MHSTNLFAFFFFSFLFWLDLHLFYFFVGFMFFLKENKGGFERVNLSYAIVFYATISPPVLISLCLILVTLQVNLLALVYLGYFYLIFLICNF